MTESRCGLCCSACEYREQMNCTGCTQIEKPFWGESCPVKACCEGRNLPHCGHCTEFPCPMLRQFAYDEKQGDGGRRICQCAEWRDADRKAQPVRFSGPMFMSQDIERTKQFYQDLLDQRLVMDFGENITFFGGYSFQTDYARIAGIDPERLKITFHANAAELYFETDRFDEFLEKLRAWPDVESLRDVREQPWGQRGILFYDPDGHIIEVSEAMESVVKRFLRQGMTVEETVARSMYPMGFVMHCQATLND